MRLGNYLKNIVITSGILTTTACQQPAVRKFPVTVPNKITEQVDAFVKSEFNKADTVGLDLLKTDTLEISIGELLKPKNLSKRLSDNSKFVNK